MTPSIRSRAMTHAILIAFLVVALAPLVIMWMTALKGQTELATNPFGLPAEWKISNFAEAWEKGRLGDALKTSLIVVGSTVVCATALSILAGFAFAAFEFRGRRFLFLFLVTGIMIPVEVMLIPLYQYLGALGLRDSYLGLIIPYTAQSVAFGAFWMRAVFGAVPRELRDAAAVDGCGPIKTLRSVMMPVSWPAIATLAVLFFMWNWNEFLMALVLIQDPELRTVPLALSSFQGKFVTNVPLLAAAASIISAPVLVLYLLASRRFIDGIASGAVKG